MLSREIRSSNKPKSNNMSNDFADRDRWGLVLNKYRSTRLEFEIRDKRDVVKLRGIIPKFQDMPLAEFVVMIGDANPWSIEFPVEYAKGIVAAAKLIGVACKE